MSQQEAAVIVTLAIIGASLVFIALVGMLMIDRFKKKRLEPFLKNQELSQEWLANSSLLHPLREVSLGLLITLVVPIFTHYCLVGSACDDVARVVGYVAGVLCALGCFSRQRRDLDSLGIGMDAKALLRMLGFYAFSLMILLWGALTLCIALFYLFQKL